MTKRELEQLKSLKLEVKQLRDEIRDLPVGDTPVTDTIKDYSFNAKGSNQVIRGYGMSEKQYANRQRLTKKLARKLTDIQDAIYEMECWLDDVPDSETRTILRFTYRNGLTQAQIGKETGYDQSVISRKIKTFWKNQTL